MQLMRLGDLVSKTASVFLFGSFTLLAGCAYFESTDVKRGDQHLAAGKWEEATVAYRNPRAVGGASGVRHPYR